MERFVPRVRNPPPRRGAACLAIEFAYPASSERNIRRQQVHVFLAEGVFCVAAFFLI